MVTVGEWHDEPLTQKGYDFLHPGTLPLVKGWETLASKKGNLRIDMLTDAHGDPALAAFDGTNFAGLLKIDANNGLPSTLPYMSVASLQVDPGYKRNGVGRGLIEAWVRARGAPLLSDNRQSHDAFALWTSLVCDPGDLVIDLWREDGAIEDLTCKNGRAHPDPAAGGDATRWRARPR